MIEGIVVSFAFLGIVLLILYSFLRVFNLQCNFVCFVCITDEMTKIEICNLVYGIYFKSIFYGDFVFNNTVLINMLTDENMNNYLSLFSDEFKNIRIVSVENINDLFI